MSLDVYLIDPKPRVETCGECGTKHDREGAELYWANITHNLNTMADKAGMYEALWRPEENGFKTAGQIVPVLERGISDLEARPEYFTQFSATNGWGTYQQFLPWLREYLTACKDYPEALVKSSR